MKVQFLKKFSKDLDNITKHRDKKEILKIIEMVQKIESLKEISGVKKLTGFSDAYRIRCGNYRIGVFVNNDKLVQFARVMHRKDIYKLFP